MKFSTSFLAAVACMLMTEGSAQLVWDQEPDDVTDTDKLAIRLVLE